MALTDKLSAIGNAIREKTGKTELLTLDAMPLEIASITTGGGGGDIEPIVLTGICSRACNGLLASKYIELYGNSISTDEIADAVYMFEKSELERIPFDINISPRASGCSVSYMFSEMKNLKDPPKINNYKFYDAGHIFNRCISLVEVPDDYFDNWDFTNAKNTTGTINYCAPSAYYYCNSLRKAPIDWYKNTNPNSSYTKAHLYYAFGSCYVMDELLEMPISHMESKITSNMLGYTIRNCYRLKRFTFETDENNNAIPVSWKGQTLDIYANVGFADLYSGKNDILKSGITADKQVIDDATYQALKDDPDWFTTVVEYSRYNHDSAVETINSLPDTSAYLATAGGTNTIKFSKNAGAKTDGGAINTLTAEEIAVATAKGWTVSLI